jgi:transposase
VLAIEKACDELLKEDPNNEDSCRLKERFLKHRDHLFTFLHLPNVPSSNNASEQALRNGVIYRKVTGGFRSDWGAQAYAQVLSVLETARRRGEDILQTLFGILSQPFKLKLSFG